jgi:hypothetical protein
MVTILNLHCHQVYVLLSSRSQSLLPAVFLVGFGNEKPLKLCFNKAELVQAGVPKSYLGTREIIAVGSASARACVIMGKNHYL